MLESLKLGLYQTFILDDNYQYFINNINSNYICTGSGRDPGGDRGRDPFCV